MEIEKRASKYCVLVSVSIRKLLIFVLVKITKEKSGQDSGFPQPGTLFCFEAGYFGK